MLYGTNASKASSDGGDRDYDPTPIPGLAALSPQRRPGIIATGGGGGYSPQGSGGGGAPAGGETPVSGSRVRSGYAPADRNTSIRLPFAAQAQGAAPKARMAFGKSGRGSKESPLSSKWGGLSDDLGFDLFGWAKARVTPPGGNITKIQIVPKVIRDAVPTPLRTAIRYAGAIPFTATVGLFTPAGVPRQIFGLSAKESAIQEMGAKAARVAAAVVATAGAATWATGAGPLAATTNVGAAGYAPAAPLSLSTTPVAAPFAPSTAGFAAPSAFGGTGTVLAPGSYATAGAANLYAPLAGATQAGLPLAGTSNLIATSASIAATPVAPAVVAPASGGWLAATGKGLVSGTGAVLKTVGIAVGSQALLASFQKSPVYQEGQAGGYSLVEGSSPSFILPTSPSGGATGGGSSGEEMMNAVGGMSPLISLGLAGLGLALYLSRKKSRRTA